MEKPIDSALQLHPLIVRRWSPRAFSSITVEKEKLHRIFEAARWAPSCFNEQPWRFLLGVKGEGSTYDRIFSCLAEGNKSWCKNVPVLVALCAKTTFTHNNKPNNWHVYDLGQAAAFITLQAMAEDLFVHQMAGFDANKLKSEFNIPEDFTPVTVMAIGYPGDVSNLPPDLQKNERAPRERHSLSRLVFSEKWEQAVEWD